MNARRTFDLIIVGAGISGTEAALASARGGMDVLVVTTSMDTVYNLVGDGWTLDPPDGTLMKDAVVSRGDERGFVKTWEAHRHAKHALEHEPGVHLLQSNVVRLQTSGDGLLTGVVTWEGVDRHAARVALCVGTFLHARLRAGALEEAAGRLSEMAYDELYSDLEARGFGFETMELRAEEASGSLPYVVTSRRFAEAEASGAHALVRIPGLYAAGSCLRGPLSFEEAAADGRSLASELLEPAR